MVYFTQYKHHLQWKTLPFWYKSNMNFKVKDVFCSVVKETQFGQFEMKRLQSEFCVKGTPGLANAPSFILHGCIFWRIGYLFPWLRILNPKGWNNADITHGDNSFCWFIVPFTWKEHSVTESVFLWPTFSVCRWHVELCTCWLAEGMYVTAWHFTK